MNRECFGVRVAGAFLLAVVASSAVGQVASKETSSMAPLSQELAAASDLTERYRVTPNIAYSAADDTFARLDVYKRNGTGPNPTLVYIHGGAWRGGPSKEQYSLWFEPFLFLGWNVVNVEYRPSSVAPAPAAVDDCMCALRWVLRNAKKYDFDTNRIVLMGHSAGGHLALMTGMAPASAAFDHDCPGPEPLKVAAIVDWFGITDVTDLLQGPNERAWAKVWVGSLPDAEGRAKRVSPLTYVRSGLPPTILIHGDADPTVPYSQAVRLHAALVAAGVPTEFITIPGGHHGGYGSGPTDKAYAQVFEFLKKNGVGIYSTK